MDINKLKLMKNKMRNLTNDITFLMPVNNLNIGYVNLYIYHNGVGVFSGRAYNDGTTPIEVNLNDIIMQNRGKYDYLKLTNDGNVVSNPTRYIELDLISKFINGQLNNYTVSLVDSNSHYTTQTEDVLAVYDYPNKDLAPNATYPEAPDTSITRLMQGCNWIYNHDDEKGIFNTELIPHYPAISTTKYGFGFQLLDRTNMEFAIRAELGAEINVGELQCVKNSGLAFLTLTDLTSNVSLNENDDTSIYLKERGASGDEFGDWIEAQDYYRGRLDVSAIRVQGTKDGQVVYDETFDEGETFRVYMRRYIGTIGADWDLDKMMAGDREVFRTNWNRFIDPIRQAIDTYEDNYDMIEIGKSAPQEFQYDHLFAGPVYEEHIDQRYDDDRYIGKCTLAVLDRCYSRYYLAWMDRYGDIQSQAFDGKVEYSENFDKTEIKDYKLRRRIIHNELQPKWKLNTKWLKEDIYPMYESIFTSPYLLLYDTETDRSWNVILTNNEYKEKTFKNEKTLFNLEITVEDSKKQNYLF